MNINWFYIKSKSCFQFYQIKKNWFIVCNVRELFNNPRPLIFNICLLYLSKKYISKDTTWSTRSETSTDLLSNWRDKRGCQNGSKDWEERKTRSRDWRRNNTQKQNTIRDRKNTKNVDWPSRYFFLEAWQKCHRGGGF